MELRRRTGSSFLSARLLGSLAHRAAGATHNKISDCRAHARQPSTCRRAAVPVGAGAGTAAARAHGIGDAALGPCGVHTWDRPNSARASCRHKRAVEDGGGEAHNADWLTMHLCIRDFFVLTALKQARALLSEAGIQGQPVEWRADRETFAKWCRGGTGFPFVDACMRELAATGYVSNRGRQNAASFLAKTLQQDWRLGAQVRGAGERAAAHACTSGHRDRTMLCLCTCAPVLSQRRLARTLQCS